MDSLDITFCERIEPWSVWGCFVCQAAANAMIVNGRICGMLAVSRCFGGVAAKAEEHDPSSPRFGG